MKTKKPDAAEQIAARIPSTHASLIGADMTRTDVAARIRRAIRAAEKRGAKAERKRIVGYVTQIREAAFTNERVHLAALCDDILADIGKTKPARKARRGGAK